MASGARSLQAPHSAYGRIRATCPCLTMCSATRTSLMSSGRLRSVTERDSTNTRYRRAEPRPARTVVARPEAISPDRRLIGSGMARRLPLEQVVGQVPRRPRTLSAKKHLEGVVGCWHGLAISCRDPHQSQSVSVGRRQPAVRHRSLHEPAECLVAPSLCAERRPRLRKRPVAHPVRLSDAPLALSVQASVLCRDSISSPASVINFWAAS